MNEAHEPYDEVAEAHADRSWWYKAAQLVDPGMILYGFAGRRSAAFYNPDIEMSGKVAKVLIKQAATIKELSAALEQSEKG